MYTAENYRRPNGQIYPACPSLKLRGATDHGAIRTVATDEICCSLGIKLQGRRIDDTTGGNARIEGEALTGDLKDGQFLSRKSPDEIRRGPAI